VHESRIAALAAVALSIEHPFAGNIDLVTCSGSLLGSPCYKHEQATSPLAISSRLRLPCPAAGATRSRARGVPQEPSYRSSLKGVALLLSKQTCCRKPCMSAATTIHNYAVVLKRRSGCVTMVPWRVA
jgi:hypothetical protein